MTITLDIKEEKLEQFWAFVKENDLEQGIDMAFDVPASVPEWQIEEVLRRQARPDRPEPRPWSEIRQKYVGKGL